MKTLKWLIFSAITAATFIAASESWATTITISTSANPIDGWRTIAPVGDLAGQPISEVGLQWEAANVGWNSSLTFDDSPRPVGMYLFRVMSRNLAAPQPTTSGQTDLMMALAIPRCTSARSLCWTSSLRSHISAPAFRMTTAI